MTLPPLFPAQFLTSTPSTHFMHSFSLQAHVSVEGLAVVKHVVFPHFSVDGVGDGEKIHNNLHFTSFCFTVGYFHFYEVSSRRVKSFMCRRTRKESEKHKKIDAYDTGNYFLRRNNKSLKIVMRLLWCGAREAGEGCCSLFRA